MGQITPVDPVTLGLCSQIDLDENVMKAARREERRLKKLAKENGTPKGEMLKDADETTAIEATETVNPAVSMDAADVFANIPSAPDGGQDGEAASEEALTAEDVFQSN